MSLQLICINFGNFGDALKAVSHCMNIFPRFDKVTLLHPDPFKHVDLICDAKNGIEIIKCKSLTQNECCMYEMPFHVTCDHALEIQWDGFIIRPDLWDDRFLDYDLIAPPWPLCNIVNPDWRVGSGGFILFSKAMGQMWREIDKPHPAYNDWQTGAIQRKEFEDRGMKFAPIELAAKFGKECDLEDIDIKEGETFGFHGFQYGNGYREKYRKKAYGNE